MTVFGFSPHPLEKMANPGSGCLKLSTFRRQESTSKRILFLANSACWIVLAGQWPSRDRHHSLADELELKTLADQTKRNLPLPTLGTHGLEAEGVPLALTLPPRNPPPSWEML